MNPTQIRNNYVHLVYSFGKFDRHNDEHIINIYLGIPSTVTSLFKSSFTSRNVIIITFCVVV